jgi:TetR/AcrR family transcriptional repressor of mexJK operon
MTPPDPKLSLGQRLEPKYPVLYLWSSAKIHSCIFFRSRYLERVAKQRIKARGPGRLSADETAKLDDRLLDAAQDVFLDQGFARSTVDAIAKAAGATRKTVYARYANKEEIFAAVIARLLDANIIMPTLDSAVDTKDPRARLLKLANASIDFVSAPQMARINRLLFAETYQTPELAKLAADLYDRQITSVQTELEALKAEGHLPNLPTPRLAAVLFIESVSSTPRLRAVFGPGATIPKKQVAAFTEVAVDVFLAGCGRHPAS